MSGFRLTATAVADACGGAPAFARLPRVLVVLLFSSCELPVVAATAGLGASCTVGPASISVGGAAATVPVDYGGAESAMWVSAPSSGGVPERGG